MPNMLTDNPISVGLTDKATTLPTDTKVVTKVETKDVEEGEIVEDAAAAPSLLGEHPCHHPLQNKWVLWYDSTNRGKSNQQTWGDNLKKICDFDTVEDFWRLYNNIYTASNIGVNSNYHLFKHGIQPAWEDPANLKGGKWIYQSPQKMRNQRLDVFWLWTLLACIGENFEEADDICGTVVSIRKSQDKICLWTKSAHNSDISLSIGRQWKQLLELEPTATLGYQVHADAMKHNSSFNNKMHYQV